MVDVLDVLWCPSFPEDIRYHPCKSMWGNIGDPLNRLLSMLGKKHVKHVKLCQNQIEMNKVRCMSPTIAITTQVRSAGDCTSHGPWKTTSFYHLCRRNLRKCNEPKRLRRKGRSPHLSQREDVESHKYG
jgi:hypothetical protein